MSLISHVVMQNNHIIAAWEREFGKSTGLVGMDFAGLTTLCRVFDRMARTMEDERSCDHALTRLLLDLIHSWVEENRALVSNTPKLILQGVAYAAWTMERDTIRSAVNILQDIKYESVNLV